MTDEVEEGPTGANPRADRLSRLSRWMAALMWAAMGMFSLLAFYSLIVDIPVLSPWFNYSMWTLNAIGLVALVLCIATNRG